MSAVVSKAIDPARVGMSKSMMTTPCARKAYFTETVRDEQGRRLSFPMPERVTFGSALDEAVTYIAWHDRTGDRWTLDEAHHLGMLTAQGASGWALVEAKQDGAETFDLQLRNALTLFVNSPDGLVRLRNLYPEKLSLQGNDGASFKSEDVIGTPDFSTSRRVGDLKSWSRNDGEKKVWRSPEMGIYAYLYAAQNGALPESVFYLAYVRVTKPYWTWIEVTGEAEMANLVALGRQTARHWRALFAAGDPELFSTDTDFCGDCPFRKPLPEYGHDGCAVGRLMPVIEEAA
jgi:hypothetical protein